MDEDFDFDLFSEQDALKWLIISGRGSTQGSFRQSVLDSIVSDHSFTMLKIYPMEADSEQRYFLAVMVGPATESDTVMYELKQRLFAVSAYDSAQEAHIKMTRDYGKSMWGEVQEYPLSVEESRDYDIFLALIGAGRTVLVRGLLDGEKIAMITHIVDIPGDQLVTPLAILVNDDLLSKIVNPLA